LNGKRPRIFIEEFEISEKPTSCSLLRKRESRNALKIMDPWVQGNDATARRRTFSEASLLANLRSVFKFQLNSGKRERDSPPPA
jgi:hypothetical protein